VLVPVVVLQHGEHVTGLTKDSFRLEENGAGQTIASVEEMKPQGPPASELLPGDGSYSNLPLDPAGQPRVTIILLGLLNTTEFQRTDAKEQLLKFLSHDMQNKDPISLFYINAKGLQSILPFTSDRTALVESLRKLDTTPNWMGHGVELATIQILEALEQIARGYTGVPGRKSLLFMGGELWDPEVGAPRGADGYLDPEHIRSAF